MRRNTAITKSPNGFGGATGADGELDRFPALSPKIDNTTVTIAVNGVTTACDTGATDDRAERLTAAVLADEDATDATEETSEATVPAAVDEAVGTTAEDTEDAAAFSSGLLDVVEASKGVPAAVTGVDLEVVPPAEAAVVGGVEAGGVSVDAGAVVPVPSPAAAPVPAVAGGVGTVVVGMTGSDVAGVAAGGVAVDSEPKAGRRRR